MRMIDLDKFLSDLKNEGQDVCDADPIDPSYSEFGYSYELIERVAERQRVIDSADVGEKPCENCLGCDRGCGENLT